MSESQAASRRQFLGAAAVGVVGLTGVAALAGSRTAEAAESSTLQEDVVLSTGDASKGVFNILVGERSIPITDLEFASKIAKAIS